MEERNDRANGFYKEAAPFPKNQYICVTKRFVDEEENPILWEVKALCQREQEDLLQRCNGKGKAETGTFNMTEYEGLLLGQALVFPDLEEAALQDSYGVLGVTRLLEKMLTHGEYQGLLGQVIELSQ